MQNRTPPSPAVRRTGTNILEWNNRHAKAYAKRRYGSFWDGCLAHFSEATIERLVRLEQDIINGEDKDLLAFKSSVSGELTMVAVAGAIVAQIAITTFSLPNNSDLHWIVRAFFICGLIMGLLSVHFSVMQQRTMGKLHRVPQIRTWLLANSSASLSIENGTSGQDQVKVSFTAAFLTQLPYTTIEYGVVFLIMGLALYLGLSWHQRLDDENGGQDDRNVLIMYVVCTGILVFQWAWAFYSKSIWLEQDIAQVDHEQVHQQPLKGCAAFPLQALNSQNGDARLACTEFERDFASQTTAVSLSEALRGAARAHRQCASADLLVAENYDMIAEKQSL